MSHTQKILEEVIDTPQRRISERTEELIVDLFMQQVMREILSGIMDTPKQRIPERIVKPRDPGGIWTFSRNIGEQTVDAPIGMEERVQNGRLEHTDDLCAERRHSWAAGREGDPRGGSWPFPSWCRWWVCWCH